MLTDAGQGRFSEQSESAQQQGAGRPPAFPVDAQWRNLRHLRAVAAVAEHGTVIGAAHALHLSQPAVTRSVHAVEDALGMALFDRNSRGMVPTCAGSVIALRTGRAFEQLQLARNDARQSTWPRAADTVRDDRFLRTLTYRQLEVFLGLAASGTETQAAKRLGMSQPAINRIIREFEASLGTRVFERTLRGVLLTPAGEAILRGASLAIEEFRLAGDDLAAHQGESHRELILGTLPLANALFVPSAIERVLHVYPDMQITVIDGTYDALVQKLRRAEIDALVGALRDPLPFPDLAQEHLFDDALAVAVRAGHPLTQAGPLNLDDLVGEHWVAPLPGTPSHAAFERAFQAIGKPAPRRNVRANSMNLIRALLLGSDRLALVSRRMARLDRQAGMLVILPVEVRHTERAIGIVQRIRQAPFPALRILLQGLREIGRH